MHALSAVDVVRLDDCTEEVRLVMIKQERAHFSVDRSGHERSIVSEVCIYSAAWAAMRDGHKLQKL